MPDKPIWCAQLDEVANELRNLPDPWVDRSLVEQLLGVGRRRAQQILAPCVSRQIGGSGVADRETVITHLGRLASGDTVHYEKQRRRRLADRLQALYRNHIENPKVIVEAPIAIINQQLDGLPSGISLRPGQITLHFHSPTEALEQLLALAVAIGNDHDRFEALTAEQT